MHTNNSPIYARMQISSMTHVAPRVLISDRTGLTAGLRYRFTGRFGRYTGDVGGAARTGKPAGYTGIPAGWTGIPVSFPPLQKIDPGVK